MQKAVLCLVHIGATKPWSEIAFDVLQNPKAPQSAAAQPFFPSSRAWRTPASKVYIDIHRAQTELQAR